MQISTQVTVKIDDINNDENFDQNDSNNNENDRYENDNCDENDIRYHQW